MWARISFDCVGWTSTALRPSCRRTSIRLVPTPASSSKMTDGSYSWAFSIILARSSVYVSFSRLTSNRRRIGGVALLLRTGWWLGKDASGWFLCHFSYVRSGEVCCVWHALIKSGSERAQNLAFYAFIDDVFCLELFGDFAPLIASRFHFLIRVGCSYLLATISCIACHRVAPPVPRNPL